jgi:hypothetical protein
VRPQLPARHVLSAAAATALWLARGPTGSGISRRAGFWRRLTRAALKAVGSIASLMRNVLGGLEGACNHCYFV